MITDLALEVGQGARTVDLRLALSEPVKVGAIEDGNVHDAQPRQALVRGKGERIP
jgi:hypothetical protein